MAAVRPAFTIGVEEEYLLVDLATRDLVNDPDPAMFTEAMEVLGPQVTPEFLRTQIEIGTRVCETLPEARQQLASLRRTVSDVVSRYGVGIIASSTHPFGLWWEQMPTDKERYKVLAEDLGWVARRLVICGMHVHVAIEDPDLRIDLMNQVRYFLPHLLALSTSSPFWGSRNTGLRSYRTSVFRTMPRTGIPEEFSSWNEYERHIEVLMRAGIIADASKLWWDVRPSARYPTLELRAPDICTRVDDAITVAACYVTFLHMLWRLRTHNQRWRQYAAMLISENVWRASRYGVGGSLMDYGIGELVPFRDLVEEIIERTAEDAAALGCVDEVAHAREIVERGTSAERQIAVYEQAVGAGASADEAARVLVDYLLTDTLYGL